jgi:hypothetical protein
MMMSASLLKKAMLYWWSPTPGAPAILNQQWNWQKEWGKNYLYYP